MNPEARLALLLLEELELRGGRSRLKYLKVYRLIDYWLGNETSRKILNRLIESGYIKVEGDNVELIKRFKVNRSIKALYREARGLVLKIYSDLQ